MTRVMEFIRDLILTLLAVILIDLWVAYIRSTAHLSFEIEMTVIVLAMWALWFTMPGSDAACDYCKRLRRSRFRRQIAPHG